MSRTPEANEEMVSPLARLTVRPLLEEMLRTRWLSAVRMRVSVEPQSAMGPTDTAGGQGKVGVTIEVVFISLLTAQTSPTTPTP